jgi:hypothetical protein
MIKGIMGSQGVVVGAGNPSLPYVNQNNSNPMQGMIRIWGTDMQVFDGNGWITISGSYATVSLDPESQELLKWAKEQRNIERERAMLVEKNPALKKVYDALIRAEENFDLLSTIAGREEEPGIVVGYNFTSP